MLDYLSLRAQVFTVATSVRERRVRRASSVALTATPLGFACVLWLAAITTSLAQDNPFGDPVGFPGFDDPQGIATNSAPSTDPSEAAGAPDTPLSLQLKQRARRGDLAAADSVAALARIGRWNDVNQLLSEAAGRQINDAVLAEMGNRIDPAVMIRIRLNETLSDEARQLIDRISSAAKRSAESPQRIQSAIEQLGSDSGDTQLAGLRILLSGGDPAIAELVQAAIAKEPIAPRDELLRALSSFGPGGIEALRQVALYGNIKTQPEIRIRAIDSLVRMTGRGAAMELITALAAVDSSDAERNSAAEHLVALGLVSPTGTLPGRDVAFQSLKQNLVRKRAAASRTLVDDQTSTLWSVNENRDGIVYQDAPAFLKAYRAAADAAARLRRLAISDPPTTYDIVSSDIGYRVLVDPDWGDADQVQAILSTYHRALTATGLSESIANAMEQDDSAALLGLLRLVSAFADSPESMHLIHTASTLPSPLVRAVDHAQPRIRFEAAAAISRIAPHGGYPGSSRVRRTLGEMSSLGELPTALLLETRPDVIIRQESLLSRLGYEVVVAGSTAVMERYVADGGDLRLVLAKTGIADTSAVELIDRIRRSPRGREFPILVYGDVAPGLDSDRWAAPALLIDPPASAAGLNELLQSVNRYQRLPMLSVIDRMRFREIATEALAKLPAMR